MLFTQGALWNSGERQHWFKLFGPTPKHAPRMPVLVWAGGDRSRMTLYACRGGGGGVGGIALGWQTQNF